MEEEVIRPEEKAFLKKVFRVRKTLCSMVNQRGYLDPSDNLRENDTFEEFQLRYYQNQSLLDIPYLYLKKNDPNVRLAIKFEVSQSKKTIKEEDIKNILSMATSKYVNDVILIVNGDPNVMIEKKAKLLIDEISASFTLYQLQVFNMDDLVFDITKHELVPQHILISQEEKKALLEKYRLTEAQFPRILLGDPVAKFLGLRHGDVVKIIRKSETAGIYVTYRIAI